LKFIYLFIKVNNNNKDEIIRYIIPKLKQ